MGSLTASQLIVETSRGPSISGRRITVYVILEHLKNRLDKEFIKERLRLSDGELNTAIEYIEHHTDEIEKEYAEILSRSEANRDRYEKIYRERSRYADLPLEERVSKMRDDLTRKQNDNHSR